MPPRESPIDIKRLAADEGLRLRTIRLRALADAPDAFGTTYDEAAAQPLDSWTAQLQEIATFVAVVNGEDVGLVRGARDDLQPNTAWLISMWVSPEVRGQGVGEALIDAVVEWARASGARRVLYWMSETVISRPSPCMPARASSPTEQLVLCRRHEATFASIN